MLIINDRIQDFPLIRVDIDFIINRFVFLDSELETYRYREEDMTPERRNIYDNLEPQLDDIGGMITASIVFLDVIASIFEGVHVGNN
jgi:hypothetical protein